MSYAPEPWRVIGSNGLDPPAIIADDGTFIASDDGPWDARPTPEENYRRIVACVNACRGWSTKELLGHRLSFTVPYLGNAMAEVDLQDENDRQKST